MIKIYSNTNIYVLCPAYSKTGGPELLHQLVNKMKELNYNVFITYYNVNNNNKDYTPEDFKKYIDSYLTIDDIVDSKENIIIFPEVYINKSKKFKYIRKCLWWLSVDNYEKAYKLYPCLKDKGILTTLKKIIKGDFLRNDLNQFDYHLCQSYYAIDYLKKIGIHNVYYLSDYINSTFFEKRNNKKVNNVLYNPKKGYEFTKKIIERAPYFNWVAIKGLTTNQVGELLSISKVYIDFGNHPGKDRFPREAAISGCCVITGKRGSAKYYDDVMIENEFKFDSDNESIKLIIKKIEECLNNYETEIKKFKKYQVKISNEEKRFVEDIKNIFIIEEEKHV